VSSISEALLEIIVRSMMVGVQHALREYFLMILDQQLSGKRVWRLKLEIILTLTLKVLFS
jgi:hypothetical protein